ncbi:uncharacterized protein LOC143370375, partial [Andrena cerasifolii]|uniref:uncharacterized protein LOC143370375 n=1 Tax=Andrena cerasifolii TaxID=2819439 RepID=UPI0040377912
NYLGAVGGKHVAIKKLPNTGPLYYNYTKLCRLPFPVASPEKGDKGGRREGGEEEGLLEGMIREMMLEMRRMREEMGRDREERRMMEKEIRMEREEMKKEREDRRRSEEEWREERRRWEEEMREERVRRGGLVEKLGKIEEWDRRIEEGMEVMEKGIKEVVRIGRIGKEGSGMVLVRLERREEKRKVMEAKRKLKGRRERVEDDLTEEERRAKWKIEGEGEGKESAGGVSENVGRREEMGEYRTEAFWVIRHLEKHCQETNLTIPEPATLPNSGINLPFVFLGDDAFALRDNFMKPYSQTGLTLEERIFNYRLSRARRVVENAFGILVTRFGVFQRPIALHPEKARKIVLACCYLHNYLSRNRAQAYISRGSVDTEDLESGHIREGTWRTSDQSTALQTSHSRNSLANAKAIRDRYRDFFNNEGQISWQESFV